MYFPGPPIWRSGCTNALNRQQIFQSLWNARIQLDNWHLNTTVSIGLRLGEVKFAQGQCNEAHDLIDDLLYNLHDVYDEVDELHPLILRCETLRARFHNRQGQHSLALQVHHDLLAQAVDRYLAQNSHEAQAPLAGTPSEAWNDLMLEQVRSLKATYELNEGWDLHGAETYLNTLNEAFDLAAGSAAWDSLGTPSTWQPVCPVPKTSRGEFDLTGLHGEDVRGLWVAPQHWTIPEDESEESARALPDHAARHEDRAWEP